MTPTAPPPAAMPPKDGKKQEAMMTAPASTIVATLKP
jgi:hypothetical protein